MLIYLEVHLYYLIPPICVLLAVMWPVLGRREGLKMLFLAGMATLWTTPWDNWILSHDGWGYPPNSVLFQVFYVPIEEHLFFILQPIFLVLLHSLISHPDILPFSLPDVPHSFCDPDGKFQAMKDKAFPSAPRVPRPPLVRTLRRKPAKAALWAGVWVLGMALVDQSNGGVWSTEFLPPMLRVGGKAFYLGWILVWITPVIGFLTYLGAEFGKAERRTFVIGAGWLCAIDTMAIRAGAWYIADHTTLGYEIVRCLPLEEFTFFLLTSYLILIATQLISHLHTLLLFSPAHPPCPPSNPISHISLLLQLALDPPSIDGGALASLVRAEETLRAGSKSFDVAKLAFGREMRIGLVAVYAWSRVTDNLIDEAHALPHYPQFPPQEQGFRKPPPTTQQTIVECIEHHLRVAYNEKSAAASAGSSDPFARIGWIPNFTEEMAGAFHLFATLIPRLVPQAPFEQLIRGYETDLRFPTPTAGDNGMSPIAARLGEKDYNLESHLPIRTTADLMRYADDVAGSTASEICFLAWSILTYSSSHPTVPRKAYEVWSDTYHESLARGDDDLPADPGEEHPQLEIVKSAREMGRALQLVNIARDIVKDALLGRLYIPLSSFGSAKDVIGVLIPSANKPVDYAEYNVPLLDMADEMRRRADPAIRLLPRTARGGTRAMLASYFVIGETIRANGGKIDERGVKVNKGERVWAAAKALWLGL